MEQYILSLDQGTSSSRAIVFDRKGQICSMAQREFTQIFPKPGWVEHNPHEIWSSQASVIAEAIAAIDINGLNIAGIGITNQRETTIVWDSETEEPVYNAIVWQDRRTSEYCDRLKAEGQTEFIRERTGLIVDAYFSATKIKWILDNVAGARERAEKGKLMFGTVDSWLIWRLTRGEVHVTDVSNASRTRLRLLREQVQQVYGRQDRQVRFPRERRHRADGLRGGIARHDDLRADLLEHAGLRRRPGQGRDLQQQQVEPAAQRITPGGVPPPARAPAGRRNDTEEKPPGLPGRFLHTQTLTIQTTQWLNRSVVPDTKVGVISGSYNRHK